MQRLMVGLLVLLLGVPIFAQEESWWLTAYDRPSGLLQVDSNGRGLLEYPTSGTRHPVFTSPNGQYFLYDWDGVNLLELQTEETLTLFPVESSMTYRQEPTPLSIFDTEAGLVAFSVSHSEYANTGNPDEWTLVVSSMEDGSVVDELRYDDPALEGAEVPEGAFPTVVFLHHNWVGFTFYTYAQRGGFPRFLWNRESGEVETTLIEFEHSALHLDTGAIYFLSSEDEHNIYHYGPEAGIEVFYTGEEATKFQRIALVRDHELLAVWDGMDWQFLTLEGALYTTWSNPDVEQLWGVSDGAVFVGDTRMQHLDLTTPELEIEESFSISQLGGRTELWVHSGEG